MREENNVDIKDGAIPGMFVVVNFLIALNPTCVRPDEVWITQINTFKEIAHLKTKQTIILRDTKVKKHDSVFIFYLNINS